MKICAAAYRHSRGTDLRVFLSEQDALSWKTAIAKAWWRREFPLEEVPPDTKIGEKYFRMQEEKGSIEEFTHTWVELNSGAGKPGASALAIPTVHSNGTPREFLLQGLRDAGEACRLLLVALENAAPHGRDYYPQGPTAFQKAAAEHEIRCRHTKELYNELGRIVDTIDQD